jgi:predicted nucleic acid-binding protein
MFHVLVRKKLTSTAEATIIINRLIQEFLVLVIETNTVTKAIEINNRYGYSYWDSLILATALLNDCSIIYSEDMQHNQIIEQNTKIINPFA